MRRTLAALALIGMTACSGGVDVGERVETGEDPFVGAAPSTPEPTSRPAPAPTAAPARANAVGDKVELESGDTIQVWSYTPNVRSNNQFIQPDPGMSFVAVDVETCAHQASSDGVASTFDFELQMPDNTRFDASFMGAKEPELDSGPQAAGDCTRGWVTFEIATGAKPAAVVFEDFNTSVKWNVP